MFAIFGSFKQAIKSAGKVYKYRNRLMRSYVVPMQPLVVTHSIQFSPCFFMKVIYGKIGNQKSSDICIQGHKKLKPSVIAAVPRSIVHIKGFQIVALLLLFWTRQWVDQPMPYPLKLYIYFIPLYFSTNVEIVYNKDEA